MPDPEQVSVEVFDQAVNAWIIRTLGRHFPGVVVQGDSLHGLYALAESVHRRARSTLSADPELAEETDELRDLLWGRLRAYEDALRAHGLPLPYDRHAYPR